VRAADQIRGTAIGLGPRDQFEDGIFHIAITRDLIQIFVKLKLDHLRQLIA